ncbi:biotin synthase BioB [Desulfatiferula olefinivorans]
MASQTPATVESLLSLLDQGKPFSPDPDQVTALIESSDKNLTDLFRLSDRLREKHAGRRVFLCSIINAKSGKCSQNCAFCAQSSFHHTSIDTYPLLSEEALTDQALAMAKAGATHYSIVTSGHSLNEAEIDRICRAVETIRKKTDLTVCGSLGMLSAASARKLIASGMTRYHHNLETARSHFDRICTTHSYDEDIETIHTAADNGFAVCSGGIFGLGESWAQRVEMAFTLRDLPVNTLPVNFLNPVPGTRLEDRSLVPALDALLCIAIFRLVNPDKNITVCGGREITLRDFQSWVFAAGANGLMIGNYLTTSGRDQAMDIAMIRDADLSISGELP